MATYRFRTTFVMTADRGEVFDAMLAPERAWAYADRVADLCRSTPPGPDGAGACWDVTLRAGYPLRLRLSTVAATRPLRIEGRVAGDLEGRGTWTFHDAEAGTAAVHRWTVRTTRPWMNLLAPLARPLFVHNHHLVMRDLVGALGRSLDADVVHCRSRGR